MPAPCFKLDHLDGPLGRGELVLTANNRLRNQILRAWSHARAAEGRNTWLTPTLAAFRPWLEEAWQQLQYLAWPPAARLIASPLQRQMLWQEVIASSETGQQLLQGRELARTADEALRSLQLWDLDPARLADEANPNTQVFHGWWKAFDAALAERGLITTETAQALVARAFAEGVLPRHARIYLQGFDDLPPLHGRLLAQAADEVIHLEAVPHPSPRLLRTQTANQEADIAAAARWSLARLNSNPDAVIGILVPDLGQCRALVERIFTQVFEPLAALPDTRRYTLPFNFSAGTPLAETPMIHTALSLLGLSHRRWELEPLCALILSPFWGDAEAEFLARSRLTLTLRNADRLSFNTADLRFYTEQVCRTLEQEQPIKRLIDISAQEARLKGKHSASHWAEAFHTLLDSLGWPGQRRLDSQEYQQRQLWHQLLEEFAALDSVALRLSASEALGWLRQLAASTPFQAQTPDSPIQILGALEGAGLSFTHAWVMGLHHRQWPPLPAPNPLLPVHLQRSQAMPHASQERELQYAQALTRNYRQCAGEVVFSSPDADAESQLNPSPLILDLPLTPLADLLAGAPDPGDDLRHTLAASRYFELLDDSRGPALTPGVQVRGGSSLFKEQAACPFNAFARLRLGACEPEPAQPGFSALARGNMLHESLADFWTRVKDHAGLDALDDAALGQLLADITHGAIDKARRQRPGELGHHYCQLEQERLCRLLHTWLTAEKERAPFRVLAVEARQDINFAGLPLTLRLDRVDALAGDELLLIDYKTGDPKITHWWGDRLQEPQLPLYAVTYEGPVAAIAFAQINARKQSWLATGDAQSALPGFKAPPLDWSQQLASWRDNLTRLAQDFMAGDARLDFASREARDRATELLPLNRLPETALLNDALPRLPLASGPVEVRR